MRAASGLMGRPACPSVRQDMDATINTIVRASVLPLSIIIIGVGNGVRRATH